jgi:hypothetical protein
MARTGATKNKKVAQRSKVEPDLATKIKQVFDRTVKKIKRDDGVCEWSRALYLAKHDKPSDAVEYLEKSNKVLVPLTEFDGVNSHPETVKEAVSIFRKECGLSVERGKTRNPNTKRKSIGDDVKPNRHWGVNHENHQPAANLGPFPPPLEKAVAKRYQCFQTKCLRKRKTPPYRFEKRYLDDDERTNHEKLQDDGEAQIKTAEDMAAKLMEESHYEQSLFIGLVVMDWIEVEVSIDKTRDYYQVFDFIRDRLVVGPFSETIGQEVCQDATTVTRIRIGSGNKITRKYIRSWEHVMVKRNPGWSSQMVTEAIGGNSGNKSVDRVSDMVSKVKGQIQKMVDQTPELEDFVNDFKFTDRKNDLPYAVYGDTEQNYSDPEWTHLSELAWPPPEFSVGLQPELTCGNPNSRFCYICEEPIEFVDKAAPAFDMGTHLTNCWKLSPDTGEYKYVDISPATKKVMRNHCETRHPHSPFHYLEPWVYQCKGDNQHYTIRIHVQDMLYKGFCQYPLPLHLFLDACNQDDDAALKCHLGVIIGIALKENTGNYNLLKKRFVEAWQPSNIDTVDITTEGIEDAKKLAASVIRRKTTLALELLASVMAAFDFIQFFREVKSARIAWNSVCLIFSRGLFLNGMFPIIPQSLLDLAQDDETIIEMMNANYMPRL